MRLFDELRLDFEVNHRFLDRMSIIAFRVNQAAYRGRLRLLKRIAAKLLDIAWLQLVVGADLPGRVECGAPLRLPHGGRGVVLHPNVRIGTNATIYHRVTIGQARGASDMVPVLGDRVTLYAGATIYGRTSVGSRTTVGAGAVVAGSIPADSLVTAPRAVVARQYE